MKYSFPLFHLLLFTTIHFFFKNDKIFNRDKEKTTRNNNNYLSLKNIGLDIRGQDSRDDSDTSLYDLGKLLTLHLSTFIQHEI